MINSRLVWFLEKENLIDKRQAGFRQNRSTTDCLAALSSQVEQSIIEGKHTLVVYFDLEKAYDCAWRYNIIEKLYQYGMKGNLPCFIQKFLSNRSIRTRINSTYSDTFPVQEGIPQGSTISCTLFSIAINEVIKSLPQDVEATLYVDDLTILVLNRSFFLKFLNRLFLIEPKQV